MKETKKMNMGVHVSFWMKVLSGHMPKLSRDNKAYGSSWARDGIWATAAAVPDRQHTALGQGSNPYLCTDLNPCSQILNPLHHEQEILVPFWEHKLLENQDFVLLITESLALEHFPAPMNQPA